MNGITTAAVLALALTSSLSAHAEDGVTATEIKLGSSLALTGPLSGDGQQRKKGAEAYFKHVNETGGINGRKIVIVQKDDSYEPAKTAENTNEFIDKDKVFVLFNYLGSPTAMAALPSVNRADIPLIGPISGAEPLRQPVNKNVFNTRASSFEEGEALIAHAVDKLGTKEIGMVYQDDALGTGGKGAVGRAVDKRGIKLVATGTHKRNATDFNEALEILIKAKPKAVVVWSVFNTAAAFVKAAQAKGFNPIFLMPSSVPPSDFGQAYGGSVKGHIIFAQTYPAPTETSFKLIQDYQRDMKAAGYNDLSPLSVESYVASLILGEALKKCGKDITREKLRQALNSMSDFDIGGVQIFYSPTNHNGPKRTYLVEQIDAKVGPVAEK